MGTTSLVHARSSEILRRALVTLGLLVLSRVGFQIPVPGMSPEFLSQGRDQSSFFGLLSALSGGAIGQTAVFSLGLLPLITAAILGWSLSRSRRWTRTAIVPIALAQALAIYLAVFRQHHEMFSASARNHPFAVGLIVMLTFTAGAFTVTWLGEMIDEFGIGHGMLLIVLGGILAAIPHALNVIYGQEEFWSTILQLSAIWTISTFVVTFAYIATRRVIRR